MDKFFNIGDRVMNKVLGEGTVTNIYLLYCEVKFDKLKTERNIQKDFLINLSR